jgi:hypothetical protein
LYFSFIEKSKLLLLPQELAIHMRSVDRAVTHGAVLKTGIAEIMKARCVHVAFKAQKTDLIAREKARVGASMRLMTTGATGNGGGQVLECEGTLLLGVATEAGLILPQLSDKANRAAVRVMTIAAGQHPIGRSVPERHFHLCLLFSVARAA